MMPFDLTLNNTSPPLFTTSSEFYPLSSSPAANAAFQTSMAAPLTTIFVVGFPDDMTEREFQNMFMFCPGFEAASLKWHCKDQEDDNSVGSNTGKKQMIGFARFRTRLEALEAVDVLSGKKVNQDKGTVLKAEMAKKNLHVKRGSIAPAINSLLPVTATTLLQQQSSSSTTTTISDSVLETNDITSIVDPSSIAPNSLTPTSSLCGRNSTVGENTISLLSNKLNRYPTSSSHNGSYDTFSPLPSDLFSPADCNTDPFLNDSYTKGGAAPSSSAFADTLFQNIRSNSSFDEHSTTADTNLISPPRHPFGSFSSSGFMMGPSPLASSSSSNNTRHPTQHQQAHHPLQQYQTTSSHFNPVDDDSYHYLSKSTPVSNDCLFGTSPLFDGSNRMGSLTMQANNIDLRSPSIPAIHRHRPSINLADQNPPCNTLYVGNLPPNTNEDELRQLFSPCRGYKRMCFRNKSQSPMCFVEFDDVVLAKHALNEHQGAHLTNSMKGGIRLSYSKNPLFIKGPGGDTPPFFNGKTVSPFDQL